MEDDTTDKRNGIYTYMSTQMSIGYMATTCFASLPFREIDCSHANIRCIAIMSDEKGDVRVCV